MLGIRTGSQERDKQNAPNAPNAPNVRARPFVRPPDVVLEWSWNGSVGRDPGLGRCTNLWTRWTRWMRRVSRVRAAPFREDYWAGE